MDSPGETNNHCPKHHAIHNIKKAKYIVNPSLLENKKDDHPNDAFMKHSYYPENLNIFLEHLLELNDMANRLVISIQAIVLCSSYQHTISVMYVVLYKTREILGLFILKAFDNKGVLCLEYDIQPICDIINYATTGIRAFEAISYIHNALGTPSNILNNYGLFLTNLQATVSFILHTKFSTSVPYFLKRNSGVLKAQVMKRFKCCRCNIIVTLNGCLCTDWYSNDDITAKKYNHLWSFTEDSSATPSFEVPTDWVEQLNYLKQLFSSLQLREGSAENLQRSGLSDANDLQPSTSQ